MWSSLLIAYIAGGFTLFPVAALLFVFATHLSSLLFDSSLWTLGLSTFRTRKIHVHRVAAGTAAKENITPAHHDLGQQLYKVGWLRVTRENNSALPEPSLGDMVMAFIASKTNTRRKPAADYYFAVLRYTTLFLYDSEKQLDCKGVIIVSNHNIRLYPNGLQEHEVFSRPSCIKLEKKAFSVPSDQDNIPLMDDDSVENSSYFLNCERCIEKEDWYFALRRASKLPANKPAENLEKVQEPTQFDQAAMNQLIATIHSDEHHFHTQWLNALLGRVFFAVYKTDIVKQFLYQKVVTKVNKMNEKTPPFLGDIRVRSVHVGQALPYLTQPRLLGMGPSGELTGECNINYGGGFKLEIDTLVKWKYSDRLRPLNLNIILSLTLKKIKGKVLFKIKEPPTNRLWFGFYEPPDMEWVIEPVVWDKRVGYSLIIKTIEAKLKELVMENMVLPNMDDFPFFPTDSAGGIFGPDTDDPYSSRTSSPMSTPPTQPQDKKPDELAVNNAAAATNPINKALEHAYLQDNSVASSSHSLPDLISAAAPDMHTQYELTANSTIESSHSTSAKPARSSSTTTRRWFSTTKERPIPSPTTSEPSIPVSTSPLRQSTIMSFAGSLLTPRRKVSPTAIGNEIEEPAPAQQENSTNGIAIPNRRSDAILETDILSTTPDSLHSSPSSYLFQGYSSSIRSIGSDEQSSGGVFSSSLSISLNSPALSFNERHADDIDSLHLPASSSTTTNRLRSKSTASLAVSEVNVNAPTVLGDSSLNGLLREKQKRRAAPVEPSGEKGVSSFDGGSPDEGALTAA
ncbi:hypothetical protein K450DRAFT_234173 [Umbelopsis ramanniana AG]|uniref:SMP-LTD domain-containing protein n=1 Tax=Umbelopsis ramanniana AG TaxID=1314678 RepID=A0AAD5ECX7_UMBRA|nr:uncharacterized protein K450DRAFT_234173 [Umbelopsis ramanniana AG]KAI8581007.1 hypothetical protein K450DRAFT_234173 [Umbelopsis ramanniana AG]